MTRLNLYWLCTKVVYNDTLLHEVDPPKKSLLIVFQLLRCVICLLSSYLKKLIEEGNSSEETTKLLKVGGDSNKQRLSYLFLSFITCLIMI